MKYLMCDTQSKNNVLVASSKAKAENYLKSEMRRIQKMFPDHKNFKIVTNEELEKIENNSWKYQKFAYIKNQEKRKQTEEMKMSGKKRQYKVVIVNTKSGRVITRATDYPHGTLFDNGVENVRSVDIISAFYKAPFFYNAVHGVNAVTVIDNV